MTKKYSISRVLFITIGFILIVSTIKNMLHTTPEITAQKAIAAFLHVPTSTITCTRMTGGYADATLIKATHANTTYIVKLFDDTTLANHESTWAQWASALGIGPQLYYQDPTNKLFIMEFIDGQSLQQSSAHDPIILEQIAHNMRLLHAASAPFAKTSELLPRIIEKYTKLHTSGALQKLLEQVYEQVIALNEILQKTAVPLAPCHNDANPRNIFVGTDNKVTFIDWGDAMLGNPLYDIAIFFVLNALPQESEKLFLPTYNPKLLEPGWHLYLEQLKQLLRFEFALNVLGGVQEQNAPLLQSSTLPQIESLNHYLNLFAQYAPIDTQFLYHMGLASLQEFVKQTR